MSVATDSKRSVPWWREPTKDQWLAWWGAWLGRVLDGFDFTVFLLLMVPISRELGVSLTAVAVVFTVTRGYVQLVRSLLAGLPIASVARGH